MRRCLILVLVCAAAMPLISAAASATEYKTFVGCDADESVASHVCEMGDSPRAFFEASEETSYEFCVEFPSEELLCREQRHVDAGVHYVDAISTDKLGYHAAYWFVGEDLVGSFVFRMNARQLEPTESVVVPPVVVIPPPPPVVESSHSAGCLKAQGQVSKLKGRLWKATERKPKAKIRTALRSAKDSARRACA